MLIILDRDGVINTESPDYIKSPDEWHPIAGSIAAIAKLFQAGHTIVVATNQSGLARKLYSLETLHTIHAKMIALVENAGGKIAQIYVCPHHPDDDCNCRKPKPGLLLQIQNDFQIPFSEMLFIGDSKRDYEAAMAVGCRFILVRTGNGAKAAVGLKNIAVFDDLLAVTDANAGGQWSV